MTPKERIIVALDVSDLSQALKLAESLVPHVGAMKVGLELLTAEGAPRVVDALHGLGCRVFFDGKFDDIPHTVAGASRAVAQRGVFMFNLHASAGMEAMKLAAASKGKSLCIAVTVLTALSDSDSQSIFGDNARNKVLSFAEQAAAAGLDGIVCSPKELEMLNQNETTRKLLKVTPGVRPTWASKDDQARVLTPADAVKAGADYLVIGRPITQPPSGTVVDAARRIVEEIAEVNP